MGANQCPYTLHGKKLPECRRAVLAKYAGALGIDVNQPKTDMVNQMVVRLRAMESEPEITNIKVKAPVKKKAKKKKK